MTEYLHELPPSRSNTRTGAIVEALSALDSMGFGSPRERAKQFDTMIRQRGFQVLQAVPMPVERAIR